MLHELSDLDIEVIKCSLEAHLKQCEEFVKLDDIVKTFDKAERLKIEEKIKVIKDLLENM